MLFFFKHFCQVSEDEFGGMINAAAALPKKFGFDWWQVMLNSSFTFLTSFFQSSSLSL